MVGHPGSGTLGFTSVHVGIGFPVTILWPDEFEIPSKILGVDASTGGNTSLASTLHFPHQKRSPCQVRYNSYCCSKYRSRGENAQVESPGGKIKVERCYLSGGTTGTYDVEYSSPLNPFFPREAVPPVHFLRIAKSAEVTIIGVAKAYQFTPRDLTLLLPRRLTCFTECVVRMQGKV